MKKIISVFLVLSILFAFAGCSGPNADMTEENITETVNVAFDALKNFDTETLNTYVRSSTLTYIITFAKGHEQFVTLGKAIFENLTVQVDSIDIESKTVTVTVKNKDLEQVAGEFTQDLLNRFTKLELFNSLSDDSWLDTNLQTLTDRIAKAELASAGVTVTLSIRQGEKNLVLYFDEEAENAVSGGALGAVKKITG